MKVYEEAIRDAMKEMSEKHKGEQYEKELNKIGLERINQIYCDDIFVRFADEEEYKGIASKKAHEALRSLDKVVCFPPGMIEELKVYRQYVPELIKDYRRLLMRYNDFVRSYKRIRTDSEEKKYKRWTKAEDEELIECVCDPRLSVLDISITMGRTVPAIKTRVSKLVGLKRISQEVAGRFIGTIDGARAECFVDGVLYKE